jgi:hypothetical protein
MIAAPKPNPSLVQLPLTECFGDFIDDLVNAQKKEMPFTQQLQFLYGTLNVISNNMKAIAAVKKRFSGYCAAERSTAALQVRVEIILIKGSDFFEKRFQQQHEAVFVHAAEHGYAAYKGDVFWHYKNDRCEFLWKEKRMLVQFSDSLLAPIVIVVNQPDKAVKHEFKKKEAGKVPLKGGAAFVNWEEVADLLFLIFARISGRICLHAAYLSCQQQGVLIVGPSGSGKTTAALSLLRGKFDYHSDEIAVLPGASLEPYLVSGLLVSPKIRAKIAHLTDLEDSINSAFFSASTVHELPDAVIASGKDKEIKPAALIVIEPVLNRKARHRIETLDEQSALVVLLGQILDPTIHTRQKQVFDSLCRLMRMSRMFKLEVGTDISSLPAFFKKHIVAN